MFLQQLEFARQFAICQGRGGGGGKGVSIWLSGGLGSGPRVLVDDRGFSSATLNLQFIASFIAVYLALAYFGSEVYLQWESPKGF